MLNFRLHNNLVPSFDSNLNHNFSHLLYADDLILVYHASHRAARNIHLCMSFYSKLTGQCPNHAKSQILFPSWFNKHVIKIISSILNINQAYFPFRYLGVLISPKRVNVQVFQPMVDKIKHITSKWVNFHLSYAA